MTRRLWARWGRWALWAGAVLAVLLAVLLGFVGVDLLRIQSELSGDDKRFQTAPLRQGGLWDVGHLPGDLDERLLGLDDDVAYRRVAGGYIRIEPGRIEYQGFPDREKLRAKTQFDLARMKNEDPDPKRRSQLLTLYGVMTLDSRVLSPEERESIFKDAASAFRNAITLDPDNDDAKTNLEALLATFGPVALPPNAPSQGKSDGKVSGQGATGSGY